MPSNYLTSAASQQEEFPLNNRLEEARAREREYHVRYYSEHQLGEPGTWLSRPAPYVLRSLDYISTASPSVLDLGCGVGRHAFPVLEKFDSDTKLIGIDILPDAIEMLRANAKRHGVEDQVSCALSDIAAYDYSRELFDFVLSVSSIEHVSSFDELREVLVKLQASTRLGGVHCFMISTDHEWYDVQRDDHIEPIIEFPLSSDVLTGLLTDLYGAWDVRDLSSKRWSVPDIIDEREIVSNSTCVQFTAVKPQGDL